MAGINRFEDIQSWQEARQLTQAIYRLTAQPDFARDFGLKDQIQRASVSVMANIAEGFDCESNLEFARFLSIARRSAAEVQSLLYTVLDIGYLDQNTFETLYTQAGRIKGLIGGLKRSLKVKPVVT